MGEVFLILSLWAPATGHKQEMLGPYESKHLCVMVFEMRRDLWFEKHPVQSIAKGKCGTKKELGLVSM